MKFNIEESDQFLTDVEEAAVWILLTNIEQSEAFAESKVNEFQNEIGLLKIRLQSFPESGEHDDVQGVRKFPVYAGRYSAKWVVNLVTKTVSLLALTDSKYPKQLRTFTFDEDD